MERGINRAEYSRVLGNILIYVTDLNARIPYLAVLHDPKEPDPSSGVEDYQIHPVRTEAEQPARRGGVHSWH